MRKYKTILIHPPWDCGLDAVTDLPIPQLCDTDCELYMWVDEKNLKYVFDIIGYWGFKYSQTIVWCKPPEGMKKSLYAQTAEFLILSRKGKAIDATRKDTTWYSFKRGTRESNEKPEMFQIIIENCTDKPRLQIYGNYKRKQDWVRWGVLERTKTKPTLKRKF